MREIFYSLSPCKCISYLGAHAFLIAGCSSLGQGLLTSTFVGEIMFAILVATLGLVLFALLIGNMQVNAVKLCPLPQSYFAYASYLSILLIK